MPVDFNNKRNKEIGQNLVFNSKSNANKSLNILAHTSRKMTLRGQRPQLHIAKTDFRVGDFRDEKKVY